MGICNGKLKREAKETGEKTIERRSENYPSLLLQLGVSTRVPSIVLGIDTGVGRGSVGYHTVSIKKGEKVSLEGHIVAKNLHERKGKRLSSERKRRGTNDCLNGLLPPAMLPGLNCSPPAKGRPMSRLSATRSCPRPPSDSSYSKEGVWLVALPALLR
jgi:hypothetical protein